MSTTTTTHPDPVELGLLAPEQRAFCIDLLPRVSRTFALSIEALPVSLREAVRVAYLLCRVVDTIEDEDGARIDNATRNALFDRFDQAMTDDQSDAAGFEQACTEADLGGESHDGELVRGASAVFAVFRALSKAQQEAIRPHVLEMSEGMREYSDRADANGVLRLTDLADLERYCYYVAGTVGNLLTDLFEQIVPDMPAAKLEVARAKAVSFGLGLQLVNIVKDVATDFGRDICFLPTELAEAHGISLDQILDPAKRPQALAVVHAVCARAREHLVNAQTYTLQWPEQSGRDVRLFCTVPLVLALATLTEVERGSDTLRPGYVPKVSREVVGKALMRAQSAVDRDAELAQLFADYSPAPSAN